MMLLGTIFQGHNFVYCTIQNLGGRKFWQIWQIARDLLKLSCPKVSFLKEVFGVICS